MKETQEKPTLAGSGPAKSKRPLIRPEKDENGRIVVTPEMRELAHALTHPAGDPYLNGRDLGFYCEQCG